MTLSVKARDCIAALSGDAVRMGDIKKQAKAIKKDHELALELWATGQYSPRLLATLIFDKKLLTQELIEQLAADLLAADDESQRNQLSDWLLANQLMKDRKLVSLIGTWGTHASPLLRRWFWYHQARLRWTGQTPPANSSELMATLERTLADEVPLVQWAMNFCAGQMGIFEPEYRARCIRLGETLGLYKDEPVSRNCTPSYLPEFIRIEVAKRESAA